MARAPLIPRFSPSSKSRTPTAVDKAIGTPQTLEDGSFAQEFQKPDGSSYIKVLATPQGQVPKSSKGEKAPKVNFSQGGAPLSITQGSKEYVFGDPNMPAELQPLAKLAKKNYEDNIIGKNKPLSDVEASQLNKLNDPFLAQAGLPKGQFRAGMSQTDVANTRASINTSLTNASANRNLEEKKQEKTGGGEWKLGVTQDQKKKADLGDNIADNAAAIDEIVHRRPDLLGKFAGRVSQGKQYTENPGWTTGEFGNQSAFHWLDELGFQFRDSLQPSCGCSSHAIEVTLRCKRFGRHRTLMENCCGVTPEERDSMSKKVVVYSQPG